MAERSGSAALPAGAVLVRTTSEFDETTVPQGLLRSHHLASDVWGVLEVRSGALRFVVEGHGAGAGQLLQAGSRHVIPPETPHHVELTQPVRFVIEFHRVGDTVSA